MAVTHTDSEGEIKHETNFLGRYCEYCNRSGETHYWCFTSDWEEGLDVNNPNPSVEILPSPTTRSSLQAGPKVDAKSLRKQIQEDHHHQKKKSVLIVALACIEYLQ